MTDFRLELKRLFFLFGILLFTSQSFGAVGDTCGVELDTIHLKTQEEVDDWSKCKCVNGTLHIQGEDIVTLDSLYTIVEVKEDLIIRGNDSLISLSGLDRLSKIGWSLSIDSNMELLNFSGLDSLETIGGALKVEWNNSLISISNLGNLTSLGAGVTIQWNTSLLSLIGLNKLNMVNGPLLIRNNASLANLTGLDNISSIEATLYITNNNSLKNLSGLNNLKNIKSNIYIQHNDKLESLSGLDGLSIIEDGLSVYMNDSLSDLNILEGVSRVEGDLSISHNDNLKSLHWLDSLTYIGGGLVISGNDGITSISSLKELKSVGDDISIANNFYLADLTGLENIISINGNLRISGNGNSFKLNGLDNLKSVGKSLSINNTFNINDLSVLKNLKSVGQDLTLYSNYKLESLYGLDSLIFIGNDLSIFNNDSLVDVSSLGNLLNIGGSVLISSNSELSICCIVPRFLNFPGDITLKNNSAGCNSISEIADSCQIDLSEYETQVWPGDLNNDEVVNMFDVLPLGFRYGNMGEARDSVSIMWMGHGANYWNSSFRNEDLVYADANGDGQLTLPDAQAIIDNFGYTHNRSTSNSRAGDDLWLSFSDERISFDEEFSIYVNLGEQVSNEIAIYGLLFQLVDDKDVRREITAIDYSNSWMGEKDTNLIALHKVDEREDRVEDRIDFGLIRNDLTNKTGGGEIVKINSIIEEIVGGRDFNSIETVEFRIEEVYAVLANDSVISLGSANGAIEVGDTNSIVGIKELNQEVKLYPNPTDNILNISGGEFIIERVSIINVMGQTVKQIEVDEQSLTFNVSEFNPGVYFVKIDSGNKSIQKRVIFK